MLTDRFVLGHVDDPERRFSGAEADAGRAGT
jgi:hypothetical protein